MVAVVRPGLCEVGSSVVARHASGGEVGPATRQARDLLHAQQGSASAIQFLRRFLPGMWGFAVFCFVAAVAVVPLGGWQGLLLALASVVPIQLAVLWWMQRRAAPGR